MSKPFVAITFLFIGIIAGLLMGATMIEHDRDVARNMIDEAIVLEIPKTDTDISRQLLYMEASMAMMKEIQRQRNLPVGPSIHPTKTTTKPKLKTAPKGG